MTDTPTSWIMFGLAALAAGFERWRSQKLLEASQNNVEKSEYALLLRGSRDEWKAKAELEHNEFQTYRDEVHKSVNESNTRLLELTRINAELKAKTDITEVLNTQEKLANMILQVTHVLERIEKRLTKQEAQ